MFTSPGEIIFSLKDYGIHWYGLIMAVSILTALFVIVIIKKKYYEHLTQDLILDLAFYLIISGIIGARLYYVILDLKYYIQFPLEIFQIWNGGLSIHGAIIGAVIAGIIYTKKNNLKFLELADLFTYGLVTGQVIGRWGNFFNSEAFGIPTNLPWKLFIPIEKRPLEFINFEYFHPTFLYESILNLIIFLVLFFVIRKLAKAHTGIVFFSYLMSYSIVRFFVESLRIDSVLNIKGIPIAQIVSVIVFLISLFSIVFLMKKQDNVKK